jgi:hypothetical protein
MTDEVHAREHQGIGPYVRESNDTLTGITAEQNGQRKRFKRPFFGASIK